MVIYLFPISGWPFCWLHLNNSLSDCKFRILTTQSDWMKHGLYYYFAVCNKMLLCCSLVCIYFLLQFEWFLFFNWMFVLFLIVCELHFAGPSLLWFIHCKCLPCFLFYLLGKLVLKEFAASFSVHIHFSGALIGWWWWFCCFYRYASIRAIETDSASDFRKLVAYWILFSLTFLFEGAFVRLLEW